MREEFYIIKVVIIKKIIKDRNQMNENVEEIHYCCLQGENLFHDNTELRSFSNEDDFFSIYDVF